jgi:hypothetical protein
MNYDAALPNRDARTQFKRETRRPAFIPEIKLFVDLGPVVTKGAQCRPKIVFRARVQPPDTPARRITRLCGEPEATPQVRLETVRARWHEVDIDLRGDRGSRQEQQVQKMTWPHPISRQSM